MRERRPERRHDRRHDRRIEGFARGGAIALRFEGRELRAFEDEPVAVALFASGVHVLARSIKYHRPRGFFCLSGHCGACLMRVGGVPNVKACQTPSADGLAVERQNAWPSASLDVLGAADFAFPAGFDPHTFMTRPRALNEVMQALVRRLAGLGRLPDEAAPPLPVRFARPRVLVIGGGPAGLTAARAAARTGGEVLLIDDQARPGGRLLSDAAYGPAAAHVMSEAARAAGATLLGRAAAFGFYAEEGGIVGVATPGGLLLVRAERVIVATGGYAQNAVFPGNDLPGVLPARAAGRLLVLHGVRPASRAVVAGAGEESDAITAVLTNAGVPVTRTAAVALAKGRACVRSVTTAEGAEVECDGVVVCEPLSPASEIARQLGAEVVLSDEAGGFAVVADERGRTRAEGVHACGDVRGAGSVREAIASGEAAGQEASP